MCGLGKQGIVGQSSRERGGLWDRNRLIKALKQCLTGEGISLGRAGFHWPATVM